jgi:hypothetical protein
VKFLIGQGPGGPKNYSEHVKIEEIPVPDGN